jgi:hypothetical protein
MGMANTYLNSAAWGGTREILYIGLVDDTETELSGGSPAYARQPVESWPRTDGVARPSDDLVFEVPASTTVKGWRGYSAITGGIEYGGGDFAELEVYVDQGQFVLVAAETAIIHENAV